MSARGMGGCTRSTWQCEHLFLVMLPKDDLEQIATKMKEEGDVVGVDEKGLF